MRSYYKGKRVWITGASTGIGRECALLMARAGAKVAISARSEEKLRELANDAPEGRILPIPLDVTDRDATIAAAQRIEKEFGAIDIAFFNAGTWEPMDLPDFDSSKFEKTMRVNFLGMVYGIEAVLPILYKTPGSQLIGMSSSVAYRGIPRAEAYCASKSAIRAMLQGLRVQLVPRKVDVSIVCPGFVKSPLTDGNDFDMPFLMETEDAGKIILRGIAQRKHEIDFPKRFTLMLKFLSILPSRVYTRLMLRTIRNK